MHDSEWLVVGPDARWWVRRWVFVIQWSGKSVFGVVGLGFIAYLIRLCLHLSGSVGVPSCAALRDRGTQMLSFVNCIFF